MIQAFISHPYEDYTQMKRIVQNQLEELMEAELVRGTPWDELTTLDNILDKLIDMCERDQELNL